MLETHFRTDKFLVELDDSARAESDRGIDIETYDSPRCHAGEQMAVEVSDDGHSYSRVYLNTDSARAFFERNPGLVSNDAFQEVLTKIRELTKDPLLFQPARPTQRKVSTPTAQRKAKPPRDDELRNKLKLEFQLVRSLFEKYLPQNFSIDLEKVRMNNPRALQSVIDDYGSSCFLWSSEKNALRLRLSELQRSYSSTQDELRRRFPDVVFDENGDADFYA